MFSSMSDDDVLKELHRYARLFKKISLSAAAAASVSFSVSIMTLPADNFQQTPDFEQRARGLRDEFRQVCADDKKYGSQAECVREKSYAMAVENFYGVPNRVALMLSWMFAAQAAGTGILARITQQRLAEGSFKPRP